MKKKKLYILGFLVLAIWGTIGYKIYQGLASEDGDVSRIIPKRMVSDTTAEARYTLNLSYEDPFLKGLRKKKERSISRPSKPVVKKNPAVPVPAVAPAPVVNWGIVQYMGFLDNATRVSQVVIVKIQNREYFLRKGEAAEGFVLEAIEADSIKIRFSDSLKYIKKQKPN